MHTHEPDRGRRDPVAAACRVVLAEDDDGLRWQLAELLRSEGYQVVEIKDGADLLRSLEFETHDNNNLRAMFDVVVMDVRLPGVMGSSVLEGLAGVGIAGRAVLISAFADDDLVQWGTLVGATAVLKKPLDLDALFSAIDRAAADGSVASMPDA